MRKRNIVNVLEDILEQLIITNDYNAKVLEAQQRGVNMNVAYILSAIVDAVGEDATKLLDAVEYGDFTTAQNIIMSHSPQKPAPKKRGRKPKAKTEAK